MYKIRFPATILNSHFRHIQQVFVNLSIPEVTLTKYAINRYLKNQCPHIDNWPQYVWRFDSATTNDRHVEITFHHFDSKDDELLFRLQFNE